MYATKTNGNFGSVVMINKAGSRYENDDYSELQKRYGNVETYIKQIANGKIHNLIVNGPPGVGKTYSVENYLNKYAQGKYKVVKGHPDDPTASAPTKPWKLPFITTWDGSQNRNLPTDSAEEAEQGPRRSDGRSG